MQSRMNDGGGSIVESNQTLTKEKYPAVVTSARNIQVISKKRVRGTEDQQTDSTPPQPSKRRREIVPVVEDYQPEPLYIKINATDELKCSIAGEVQYMRDSLLYWSADIGEAPVNAAANNTFVAVAGNKNSVHVFSKVGRRLLPPIILDSLPQHICCNKDKHLAIMTSEKMVYLWDVLKMKCIVHSSADHIIHRDPREIKFVDDIGVTPSGVPVVTLSNGESYMFNRAMKTWLSIADSHAPLSSFVSSATHLYDNDDSEENYENLTYRYLKTKAARLAEQRRFELLENGEDANQAHKHTLQTIEDLEIGLASTAALSDAKGYIHFLKAYAHHLSQTDNADRLRDLCDSLLGPVRRPGSEPPKDWDPYIAGISKRSLLNKVLTYVGRNLSLQRVILEYKDILSQVSDV